MLREVVSGFVTALENNTTTSNITKELSDIDRIIETGKSIASHFYGLFNSISLFIQYLFAWGFSLAGIRLSDSFYILIGNVVSWYLASALIKKATKISTKKAMIISALVFGSIGIMNVITYMGWLPWKLGG